MQFQVINEIIWTGGAWLPAIRITPDFELPTYYVVISLVFCVLLFWLAKRTEQLPLERNTALDLALAIMIGGFLGARLLHIAFEAPVVYFNDPMQAFRIWEGGFVWYGGAIGGTALGLAFAKKKKLNLATWFDFFAPLAAAGYAGGRVACLLTGCCYGGVCRLIPGYAIRLPAQGFAVIWEAAVAFYLLHLEKAPSATRKPGDLFVTWLILHSIGRILMELMRDDERGPSFGPLSISMLLSIVILIGASVWRARAKAAKTI